MGIFRKDPVEQARRDYAVALKKWDRLENAVLDFAAESGADLRPFEPEVHQMSKQNLRIVLKAEETPESKKTLLQAWKNLERRALYPEVPDEKYAFSGLEGMKDLTHEIHIPLDRFMQTERWNHNAYGRELDKNTTDQLITRIESAVKTEKVYQRHAQRHEDVDYRTRIAEERSGPSRPGHISG